MSADVVGHGAGLEIELKLGLNPASSLEVLLQALPEPVRVVEQRNNYLRDQNQVLVDLKAMLRVRENQVVGQPSADNVVITVKRRTSSVEGVFRSEEREQVLNAELWRRALSSGQALDSFEEAQGPVFDWLSSQGIVGLYTAGRMDNRRHIVHLQGYILEVDQTRFPDGSIDAEVEVETSDPEGARQVVAAVAATAGVTLFEQTLGKYARYLRVVAKTGSMPHS